MSTYSTPGIVLDVLGAVFHLTLMTTHEETEAQKVARGNKATSWWSCHLDPVSHPPELKLYITL